MKISITIFSHEIKKIFSDKKILSSLILTPILIVFMFSFLSANDIQPDKYTIYALDNSLNQSTDEFDIIPVEYKTIEDLKQNIKLDPTNAVVNISDEKISIYYNEHNNISILLAETMEQLFYNNSLINFGVINNINLINSIELIDLNQKINTENLIIASLLPYLLVILLFQNTSNYIIDSITGEKEKGAFSKILLTPNKSFPVISGKVLAGTVCGIFSTIIYLLALFSSNKITGKDIFGITNNSIELNMILIILICTVILSCFVSGLASLYSLYSKTVKEAQSLSRICFIFITIAALFSMMRTGIVANKFYLIPIYNVCLIMQDALFSTLNNTNILITLTSLSICSLIIIGLNIFLFKKEIANQ